MQNPFRMGNAQDPMTLQHLGIRRPDAAVQLAVDRPVHLALAPSTLAFCHAVPVRSLAPAGRSMIAYDGDHDASFRGQVLFLLPAPVTPEAR